MRLPSVHLPSGIAIVIALLGACVIALGTANYDTVRAADDTCNVVIAMDRSASIGTDNWNTKLKAQVLQLADLTGNALTEARVHKKVQIAFWTFSHTVGVTDFNAPHSPGFSDVNNPGTYNALSNAIPRAVDSNPGSGQMILEGQTNYAQGLGYDTQSTALPLTLSQNSGISSLASQANVIVLLTDGLPNYPGGLDANPIAEEAGRQARLKYGEGVNFVGGFISSSGTVVPPSLKYALNGNYDDASNVGPLSFGGNTIYDFLAGRNGSDGAIAQACNAQVTASNYSLKPVVSLQSGAVITDSNAPPRFGYMVHNDGDDAGTSGWQIYDVVIDHNNGNPTPFSCGGNDYCDNKTNCADIMGSIGGTGGDNSCKESVDDEPNSSGGMSFPSGATGTSLADNKLAKTSNLDSLPAGTRICRVLRLTKATGTGGPRIHGACAVVGKTPLVQVHGGDVRVGRHFINDTNTDSDGSATAGIYTSKFTVTGAGFPGGKVFGSWVEYGALAPGPIMSFASGSGYAAGHIPTLPIDSCDKDTSRLTFANVRDTGDEGCGNLSQTSMGLIPNIIDAVRSWPSVSATTPIHFDQNSVPGRYISTSALTIDASTIKASDDNDDNTYIVFVPNNTVTITGNITIDGYNDAGRRYTDIKKIPQVIIVAKEIRIQEGVQRVDAWLVAHRDSTDTAPPSDTDGVINTCVDWSGGGSFTAAKCKDPLLLNGPIMARQLQLWRTTVYPGKCTLDDDDCVKTVDKPGEMINLPGSTLLWAIGQSKSDARVQTTYTTELPPYY